MRVMAASGDGALAKRKLGKEWRRCLNISIRSAKTWNTPQTGGGGRQRNFPKTLATWWLRRNWSVSLRRSALCPTDSEIERQISDAMDSLDDNIQKKGDCWFHISGAVSDELRAIGFHTSYGAQEFLEWYRDLLITTKAEAEEAAQEAAEEAQETAEEAAKEAAEEAAKEAYNEAYKEAYEEAYKDALREAVA